jgi:hypothetical protein
VQQKQVKGKRTEEHEEDEQPPAPDHSGQPESSETPAANADDILEEIDLALRTACGFRTDEKVSATDFDERARLMVMSFVQKGGQ